MRAVVAIALLCFVGCDSDRGPRTTQPPAAKPVEVMLARSAGLPRFDIQATFGANQDPAPHIQPITAALAGARATCSRGTPALAAVLDVEVRGKRLHAAARNPSGECLAHAIDGTAIDDSSDYSVKLLVSAG
ncbi:MAG TPA: hypothetical protein VFQ65_02550 [Kofleriaceae bacterium]|nr:hypothetical protein [Kofleriaceae bacterium]